MLDLKWEPELMNCVYKEKRFRNINCGEYKKNKKNYHKIMKRRLIQFSIEVFLLKIRKYEINSSIEQEAQMSSK